jgi:predicted HicB family RNase H-like nuclease
MSRNLLRYKGYLGHVRFDAEELVLRGRVININDILTFQGTTPAEAIAAFQESVDDYLEQCVELGQKPDRPFSGRLTLRMKPRTHRILQTYARFRGRSLNGQIERTLEKEASRIRKRLDAGTVVDLTKLGKSSGKKVEPKPGRYSPETTSELQAQARGEGRSVPRKKPHRKTRAK